MGLVLITFLICCALFLIWKLHLRRKQYAGLELHSSYHPSLWQHFYYLIFTDTNELTRILQVAGTLFSTRSFVLWPGGMPYFFISNADEAGDVLRSQNINKSRDYSFMWPWLGNGLITSGGNYWRQHRRILTPSFFAEILESYAGIFARHGASLVERISNFGDEGEVETTMEAVCEAILGRRLDSQSGKGSEYATAVHKAHSSVTALIRERMQTPWVWNDFLYALSPAGRLHNRSVRIIHDFGDEVVREKLAERAATPRRRDGDARRRKMAFLEHLVDLHEDGLLSANEIREELDNFVFAGHDTSTMGLLWTLFLLGHHPECQASLQAELDEFITSPADFHFHNIKNLKYLECCFKESLRLYPPVPFFGRTIDEPCKIGKGVVPPGVTVGLVPLAIHRDPRHWDDPEVFRPQRFEPQNSRDRHPFAYIPFSAGSRNCIGQRFALLEAKVILGMIFKEFTVTALDRIDLVQPVMALVLRPNKQIRLKFTKRFPNDADRSI